VVISSSLAIEMRSNWREKSQSVSLVLSVSLSAYPHVRISSFPTKWISVKFRTGGGGGISMKMCRGIPDFIKMRQKHRALYMKNYVRRNKFPPSNEVGSGC
jgi:hypothetical protein